MSSESTNSGPISSEAYTPRAEVPRVRGAIILVALFWTAFLIPGLLDLPSFTAFLVRFGAVALLLLLFCGWWLLNRRISWSERLAVLGLAILGGAVALLVLMDPSVMGMAVLFYAVPAIITGWTLWLAFTRHSEPRRRRFGLIGIPILAWILIALVRMDGLSGENTPVFHWRWTPSGEERFLAERVSLTRPAGKGSGAAHSSEPLVAGPHDWPRFRGPNFDSAVHGVKIATDWDKSPPKQIWRHRIGPGWSSLTVVANRVFTQEQRDQKEAVVCFDAETGDEVWSHEDEARFYEAMGGAGPRATPTLDDGRVYALGATGVLNCLDAATGELKWSQDIVPAEVKAAEKLPESEKKDDKSTPTRPMWGYSSSPLVVEGVVIVFAGGDRESSLVAYKADSGELAWKAESGRHSYCSPQPATLDGVKQVLFVSNDELTSVDPATGRNLWRFESAYQDYFSCVQPYVLEPSKVLFSFTEFAGTMLLDVKQENDAWKATQVWKNPSHDLKPYFNDFVRYEGSLYGFDGGLLTCVDLETGKRRWKKGRYGGGQALLLADQGILLVISEKGEAVLVPADPKRHQELARFQAIEGKTWNHPTIVDGKLYVRNAEEIACYALPMQ